MPADAMVIAMMLTMWQAASTKGSCGERSVRSTARRNGPDRGGSTAFGASCKERWWCASASGCCSRSDTQHQTPRVDSLLRSVTWRSEWRTTSACVTRQTSPEAWLRTLNAAYSFSAPLAYARHAAPNMSDCIDANSGTSRCPVPTTSGTQNATAAPRPAPAARTESTSHHPCGTSARREQSNAGERTSEQRAPPQARRAAPTATPI